MIRSMTGFGKASGSSGSNLITVEVKSLNSKFLELNLRLPSVYKDKDLELRNEITRIVERGKVDFTVTIEQTPGSRKSAFNKDSIRNYHDDFLELKKESFPQSKFKISLRSMILSRCSYNNFSSSFSR